MKDIPLESIKAECHVCTEAEIINPYITQNDIDGPIPPQVHTFKPFGSLHYRNKEEAIIVSVCRRGHVLVFEHYAGTDTFNLRMTLSI